MPSNLEKFRSLLEELFQLKQADLDFGIYRIMNTKREEIVRFLDKDLLPQVKEAFSKYKSADKVLLQKELDEKVAHYKADGIDPDTVPKVRELRQQITESAVDVTALENEVFSHLTNFFRRYYNEGDFISLRRYKEGVYAIPYEGEEVKLHWANADQYYVKSSETFRDYTFKIPSGKRVRVHLVAASTEQDNNKAAPGKDRRFVLCTDKPVTEENGELYIRFEYRPSEGKERQDDLNQQAVQAILKTPGFERWTQELCKLDPTEKKKDRTVLEKHLLQYTARNTFDYFIHKDLGGFLRRELDFYIKNEVMHLDDIEHGSAPEVEQYLSQIKVIRSIAYKIILFLEQLENFQKKLWLKKKFVIETNYCITLDRVPEELYPEIAVNAAQREEWIRLFAIDEIKGDLISSGYTDPLTAEFLKANDKLLLDTRLFDRSFKDRLLASMEHAEENFSGVLVHSENFQALSLMLTRLREQVKCVYIDPPYNTNSSAILYKNNYRHSSWCTLMHDRMALIRPTMTHDGAIFVSIDKAERTILEHAMNSVFGSDNRIEELVWVMNTTNSQVPNYSTNHEYVEVYARNRQVAERDPSMFREPKPGYEEMMAMIDKLTPSYPSIATIEAEIRKLYAQHKIDFKDQIEAQGLDWDDESGNDPWKGLFNYSHAEYRDSEGRLVPAADAQNVAAKIWVWQEADASMPASKQAASTRDPASRNWRFYQPLHPITKPGFPG